MNVISKLTNKASRTALKSAAVGAMLLTVGVGGAAAQPDQAANLVNLWAPGEVFRNIAEGIYYISETFGNGLLFEGPDLIDVDINFSLFN